MNKNNMDIPKPTIQRLPLYLHFLNNLSAQGKNIVSSAKIAEEYGFDATQVRKDLALAGQSGTARIGFTISDLIDGINKLLGWDKKNNALLVGAGSMGTALLKYENFKKYGLNIIAVFDNNKNKIGKKIDKHTILSMERFKEVTRKYNIDIGIITVPYEYAQYIADIMSQEKIKGIWNFAPVAVKVPDNIFVENARLSTSLACLTTKLT